MIVGRHRSCDVVITDDTVSGRHCKITDTPDGFVIEDLGSSNGTFVNAKRIKTATLESNDQVALGLAKFVFIDGALIPQTMITPEEDETAFASTPAKKKRRLIAAIAIAVVAVLGFSADLIGLFVDGKETFFESESNNSTSSRNDSLYEAPLDVQNLIADIRSAVVEVKCGDALGSGWPLVSGSQTVIVTNHHVIESCLKSRAPVSINFSGGSVSSDDYMFDEDNDLAVIKTSHSFEGLETAEKPRIGHWVMAVGNPLGLDRSVNFGTVSNVEDTQIILDVAINPGNSGGPLINADGKVVGVTSSAVTDADNIGIAIALKQLCVSLLVCEEGKW